MKTPTRTETAATAIFCAVVALMAVCVVLIVKFANVVNVL